MDRRLVRSSLAAFTILVSSWSRAATAQTVEEPVPFDSAARVIAITPTLAERLQLRAPGWPVIGGYREARLYAVRPTGGFVLVVHRATGALERTALTEAQRDELRTLIDAGMSAAGRPTGETGSTVISEPAGFAFARDQGVLGLALYGPLAASLSDDGATAGSAYLIAAGGAFFVSYGLTGSQPITRAQSDLAQHFALDFAGEDALWTYALGADNSRGARALALGAAAAGTITGVSLGRTLSDAESHAATAGITATALTTWGIASIAGATGRTAAALVGAGGIVGYGVGLAYPRHVPYAVSAGDVNAVYTSGIIGAGLGGIFIAHDNVSTTTAGLVLTPAYLAGLWAGDRLVARPYDLTAAQGRLLQIGAGAGALMGLAIPMMEQSNNGSVSLGWASAGAAVGGALTLSIMNAHSSHGGGVENGGARVGGTIDRSSGVRLSVASAAMGVMSGVPGRYSIIRWSF
jgi:hypothetical protein